MVVNEGSNVTLKCAATGSPTPTITWRREGGEPISLPGGSEGNLLFFKLTIKIVFLQQDEYLQSKFASLNPIYSM